VEKEPEKLTPGVSYRQFFENHARFADSGLFILNAQEEIIFWSRYLEREYGVTARSVLGKPILQVFPVLKHEILYPALRRALDEGRRTRLENSIHQTLNRGGRLQSFWVVPLTNRAGKVEAVMVTIVDVTRTVTLEEEVRHSDKLATAGQLASGIAHEIGTPLGIISGTAEYLMRDLPDDSPLREDVEAIFSEARRIRGLINQLLDYARVQKIAPEPLSIVGVLDRVCGLLRAEMERVNIAIERVGDPSLPSVSADRDRLQQILLNILINAIQAQPHGGRIRVSAHNRPQARQYGPRGAVEIEIMDWGPGIAEEDAERAFDPFFTTKDPGQGTGMGLAVARRLVEEHGGTISIRRAAEAGAIVRVLIPVEKRGDQ